MHKLFFNAFETTAFHFDTLMHDAVIYICTWIFDTLKEPIAAALQLSNVRTGFDRPTNFIAYIG